MIYASGSWGQRGQSSNVHSCQVTGLDKEFDSNKILKVGIFK